MSARIYSNIETAGGLLPADLLAKVAASDQSLGGLEPGDYHLGAGERLNEAISRSWVRLVGVWKSFTTAMEKAPEADLGTGLTREKWLAAVFQELGYGRLEPSTIKSLDGKEYPVSHFWNHSPIHQVGFRLDLDKRTAGAVGAARFSPHSLVQQFLNASDDHLWGLVTNGLSVRLLRDNRSLTRQPYLEFDLRGIFETGSYAEFAVFWLFCHQSRLEGEKQNDCWLEKWALTAQESGVRALDELRNGVQRAIETLGQGFLAASNSALKEKLRSGSLSTQDYYRQLLRLVYRLIFLFVAEDRNALHPAGANDVARKAFADYYSTRHLREIARRFRGTKHPDLIQPLWLVMAKLGEDLGCPELGLPALGSFLWSKEAIADIGECVIANRDLLEAIRKAAFTEQDGSRVLRSVDFANLGSEELGGVYEALLELQPDLDLNGLNFTLVVRPGNERKLTGSYYTPDSLIRCLLDSALEPVVAEALKKSNPEEAILALKVCDPACGSGHFLVASAHRLAKHLARIRSGEEEPSPQQLRHALRDVIGHCLYGVDVNEMSVELCKFSLWMEGLEPGKPLSFLDHRIQCGNSLLGATPALIANGIPDNAFTALEGDDKKLVSALRKRNKYERDQADQITMDFVFGDKVEQTVLAESMANINALKDDSVQTIHQKTEAFSVLGQSPAYLHAKAVADAWCSVFVAEKNVAHPDCYTWDTFSKLQNDSKLTVSPLAKEAARLSTQYQMLHWHLAFPDVFMGATDPTKVGKMGWLAGFDVMLGNPPWERVKLQEKEYFSAHNMKELAEKDSKGRETAIQDLKGSQSIVFQQFIEERKVALREKHFISASAKFEFTGVGDINTFAVFTELYYLLINEFGRAGIITQTQLITEKTYSGFVKYLVEQKAIGSCYSFENEKKLFSGAHHSTRFILLTMVKGEPQENIKAAVALHKTEWLDEEIRRYILTAQDLQRFNPITFSFPQFRTQYDAAISKYVYRKIPLLKDDSDFRREISISRVMHDKDDAHVIHWENKDDKLIPIIESKFFEQFNHRYATFENVTDTDKKKGYPRPVTNGELCNATFSVEPRKWVSISDTPERFKDYPHEWLLHVRKITNNIMYRTVISAITPKQPNNGSAAWIRNDRFTVIDYLYLLGVLNSFVFDYFARQKVGGLNLNSYHLYQLPVPKFPSEEFCSLHQVICESSFELSYVSKDLGPLAEDYLLVSAERKIGAKVECFAWDEDRRYELRGKIDAAVAVMYGLSRSQLEMILDPEAPGESFRVIKEQEIKDFGVFKTKLSILRYFDALAFPEQNDNLLNFVREPFKRIRPKDSQRYKNCVPIWNLKAAAGSFSSTQDVEQLEEWAELATSKKLKPGMFVAQVVGKSMEPTIPDGAWGLFSWPAVGSRDGRILLVENHDIHDPETGGRYTVKRYKSTKVSDGEGGWKHTEVRLEPLNKKFQPIVLTPKDEDEVRVVADFVEVLV